MLQFVMVDFATVLLPFDWSQGQCDFVHLGVASHIVQGDDHCFDDGPNKFFGSYIASLFHDSLSDDKIVVGSPLLPGACSVFTFYTF